MLALIMFIRASNGSFGLLVILLLGLPGLLGLRLPVETLPKDQLLTHTLSTCMDAGATFVLQQVAHV